MARRDLTGAIDLVRLEAYAAGDSDLIEEVLGLFDEQSRLWLRMLDDAGAADGFRDAAHTLKGAALGLCADELATACGEAEARASEPPAMRAVLAGRIRDAVDRVLADAAAWRHERLLQSLKSPATTI